MEPLLDGEASAGEHRTSCAAHVLEQACLLENESDRTLMCLQRTCLIMPRNPCDSEHSAVDRLKAC